MISYTKTETKEISCVLMIAETRKAVTRYVKATVEDLAAAGYYNDALREQTIENYRKRVEAKDKLIDELEKKLQDYRDSTVARGLYEQAKLLDKKDAEIQDLKRRLVDARTEAKYKLDKMREVLDA